MQLDKQITSTELSSAHVTAAYFGRLVGVSAMRIGQLIREGVIVTDEHGVRLLPSLRKYFGMKAYCWRGGYTVEDYLRHFDFNDNGEPRYKRRS